MMLIMETKTHSGPAAGGGQAAGHQQQVPEAGPAHALLPAQQMQHQHQQQQAHDKDDQEHQEPEEEVQQRVLEPLQPHLQLLPVQLLDVQHASALVSWPQATYTLPEHDNDDEQVAYQLQVHYRVSYTLQVQPVPLGPPTAEEPVEQLLSRVPGAVVDSAWKDVLTLEEAPAQAHKVSSSSSGGGVKGCWMQYRKPRHWLLWCGPWTLSACLPRCIAVTAAAAVQVGSLRAGRFYAVRLRGHVYAELDSGPVFFNDTFSSGVVAFRTLPCAPGQMQAPSLARRDRTLLKVGAVCLQHPSWLCCAIALASHAHLEQQQHHHHHTPAKTLMWQP